MMDFNVGFSGAMGAFGAISILGLLVGLVKEVLIIVLLFKGVKIADIYIKKKQNPHDGN